MSKKAYEDKWFWSKIFYLNVPGDKSSAKKLLPLWTNFKNSFTRWTLMKRIFFGIYEFLVPVIFWPIFSDIMDQKIARSKKVVKTKNQFFHAHSPLEGIIEIRSAWGLIFLILCPTSTSWHIEVEYFRSKLFDLINFFWHYLPKNHWAG